MDIGSLRSPDVRNPKWRHGCFCLRVAGKALSKAFLLALGHWRILTLYARKRCFPVSSHCLSSIAVHSVQISFLTGTSVILDEDPP